VIEEIELPASLDVGQVLVKIHYSGICGSQLGEIDGAKGEDKFLPHLLGHEGSGTVVAVGDHCLYPPATQSLPKAGSYLNPNLEKILYLKPEWLIVQGKNPELERLCRSAEIHLLAFDLTDVASIFSAISRLGTEFHCLPNAEILNQRIRGELAAIKTQTQALPRPRTLLCLSRSAPEIADIITANHTVFASELLELAGGENLMGNHPQPYPTPAISAIIQSAPEVILDVWGGRLQGQSRAQRLTDWRSLPMLPAVASGRVYVIDRDDVLIPGPRVAQAARHLTELLHGHAIAIDMDIPMP
jgi:ABC-type Fe3+-hydroxamate transport system substrate-binding protein